MSKHDPRVTLRQIRQAAQRLHSLCAGKHRETVLADWQAVAAIERQIEVVGEAVKRLSPELRARYPVVPWKEIAGTRDRLSHGYDDVNYEVLWEAVEKDVPALLATIELMLKDLEGCPER
jgi:uncharacterized protein with HEPN domain